MIFMDLKKVIFFIAWGFMVLMPAAVGWSVQEQVQTESDASLSQEDLEIIRNLDLLENLLLFNEEDLNMFIEPEFDAVAEK